MQDLAFFQHQDMPLLDGPFAAAHVTQDIDMTSPNGSQIGAAHADLGLSDRYAIPMVQGFGLSLDDRDIGKA